MKWRAIRSGVRRARRAGLEELLDVPVEEVGLEWCEIEVSRRLVDQLVALVIGVGGDARENPVQSLLDVRLSQAHGAIVAFQATGR